VEKIMFMLKSRKFWVSIVGLAVAFGLLEANDVANEELVQSLLVIVSTISYVISVAIEDAGRHSASQVIVTPAPSVVPAPPLTSSFTSAPAVEVQPEVIVITDAGKEQ
jgi:hypothetical protein